MEDPDGIYHNVVIDEDDCYLYYAEKLLAFNFMITMINKDMLHILQVPIKEKNPIKLYQMILNYFKGNKHHHVERARTLQAQHRLSNGDIVGDLSHLKLLISNLAQAQGSDLPAEVWYSSRSNEKRAATSSNTDIPLCLPAEVVIRRGSSISHRDVQQHSY